MVADEPVHSVTELSTIGQPPEKAPQTPGSAAGLQTGLAAAEARARRLAADVELVQSDVRRQVELAFSQAEQDATTRSSRWQISALGGVITRLAPMRLRGEERATHRSRPCRCRGRAFSSRSGSCSSWALWLPQRPEAFSGPRGSRTSFSTAGSRVRRCVGAQRDCRPKSRAPGMGRRGSAALRVRTDGAGDGEGPGTSRSRASSLGSRCLLGFRPGNPARWIRGRLSGGSLEEVRRIAPRGDAWAAGASRRFLETPGRQRRGTRFDDVRAARGRRDGWDSRPFPSSSTTPSSSEPRRRGHTWRRAIRPGAVPRIRPTSPRC